MEIVRWGPFVVATSFNIAKNLEYLFRLDNILYMPFAFSFVHFKSQIPQNHRGFITIALLSNRVWIDWLLLCYAVVLIYSDKQFEINDSIPCVPTRRHLFLLEFRD